MIDCIFCKIAVHDTPKKFTYEDREIMAFPDIHPIAKVHILIMPKKHIKDLLELKDNSVLEKLKNIIQKIIKEQKLEDKGYRIVVNGGGAQVIDHLHFHLIGPLGKKVSME
ncbi:MAG: hypothetical protein A3H50_01245 [Candidatus Levybacteria bacterium RIFCSPLOWO2_02_FULL_37_10]|nr:MAG: hypothetical protein A2860_01270 [Candidatus Levybacteria bacterium RIFCSPHIGHO2_01_FULL_37_33]OGH16415.1 MAG: hypothetical protein A3C97_02785 [Candidatus Levybacteria bacterium RIFCSPHIGHO2_02_FULL_37_11]OGH29710.1 MAG: hypothetical protein A3F30_03730 [Candidatus Levybacteria bacterium RIFCSPHIGHO2_12_FULL_37_12]OGH44198.1 MAG: hypothetical protein A3H50_01245 [Candidatus Levybacteria bacterium RIFCSPLOWO2_02_FULL_37_10]